jgi:hypothetical protein
MFDIEAVRRQVQGICHAQSSRSEAMVEKESTRRFLARRPRVLDQRCGEQAPVAMSI